MSLSELIMSVAMWCSHFMPYDRAAMLECRKRIIVCTGKPAMHHVYDEKLPCFLKELK